MLYSYNATYLIICMSHTILLAEDDPVQRKIFSMMLAKKLGYEVIAVENGQAALARVEASNVGSIAAVLLDIQMPEMDGFETLKSIRKYRPDLPVLMLTGNDDTNVAVRAIKDGASDFIVKPPEPTHLDIAIKNAIRISSLSRELAKLKRDKEGALSFTDLVGHSAGLAEAVAYGRKAAASDVPVLLAGETGVGKELFARAIHGESKRVGAPFIALNCGAIPAGQVEATLFAYDKGAFRRAEGGTLFLDDIDKLSAEAQVKLLHLLQQKEIEAVTLGKKIKVNVRLISAASVDFGKETQAGRFREDLYFRLNILPIALPSLHARKQDIVPLAEYFIERLSLSEGLLAKALHETGKHYLVAQPWPGNVRELENLVHRALVLCEEDEISDALLARIHASNIAVPANERRATPMLHLNLRWPDGHFKTMSEIETETMKAVMAHFEGNITRASDVLGMAKSTFYRKIKTTP